MRLPSLEALIAGARVTLARFPLVLVSAFVAAGAGFQVISSDGEQGVRLMLVSALGISLFTALTLLGERRVRSIITRWLILAGGVLILFAFYLVWPHWTETIQATRLMQLAVAFHLAVAVLPFLGYRQPNGFWQYNLTLFTRILLAALYSQVLFLGLAIALAALDKLFGINVEGDNYGRLALLIGFVFSTWFFLAGVPKDLDRLEEKTEYPIGIKTFTQYVLIPIVVIYLLILTAYLGKIVITQVWPSGWIGWLVSCVSVAGILALLLVHPIAEREENRWIATYSRGFYLVLLPSLAMLWLAIGKRIAQYGYTEQRYFLVALTAWLTAVALYFGLWKSRDIRLIPATLMFVVLFTFIGPWSAYQVSLGSQQERLKEVLTRHGMVEGDSVVPAEQPVPLEDRREMSAMLRYLVETHGMDAVEWLGDVPESADTTHGFPQADVRAREIMQALNLEYVERYAGRTDMVNWNRPGPEGVIDVRDYDYLVPIQFSELKESGVAVTPGLEISYDSTAVAIRVLQDGNVALLLPLDSLITILRQGGDSKPTITRQVEGLTVELRPTHLNASLEGERPVVEWMQGWVLIKQGVGSRE